MTLSSGNWNGDVSYYSDLVRSKPGNVLDMACGTGRITIPVAKLGVKVTGLDLVPAMLKQAEEKANHQALSISLVQADMRKFDLGQKFDWVLLPFNSMQHLHTMIDASSMLDRGQGPSKSFGYVCF